MLNDNFHTYDDLVLWYQICDSFVMQGTISRVRSLSKTLQQCETAKVLKTSQYCENALKSRVDDGVGYSVGHWVINGVVGHGRCRGFGHGVGHCILHGVSLF